MAEAMTGPGYFYAAINESQLLRAFGTFTIAAHIVIRAIVLLTHAGLIAKCLYVRACRHAVRIAAGQHFHDKYFEIQNIALHVGICCAIG